MRKFAVTFKRQLTEAATLVVAVDTQAQAVEKANAELTEEDWHTLFNLKGDAEVREVREI